MNCRGTLLVLEPGNAFLLPHICYSIDFIVIGKIDFEFSLEIPVSGSQKGFFNKPTSAYP